MQKAKYWLLWMMVVLALGIQAETSQAGFFDDLAKSVEELASDQGYESFKDSQNAVKAWGKFPLINSNGDKFKLKLTNQADGFARFARILDKQKGIKWWLVEDTWNASHHDGPENMVTYVFGKNGTGDQASVVLQDVMRKNRHRDNADDDTTFNHWEIAEHIGKLVKEAGQK